ncbi:YveK family protein [Clostridium pasteurianum]|uniref:Capsular polysaccharide biosynthesis protein n=1 Tax=Clostridium pasteurianum BC1 TaxID=86416 RepID=R4JYG0_CLOPA|nr:Wzz/FepE/Etk N-terminal domain-containing protein [Clostridium pasteurianum]AGK95867.1 capsular polysaccharide biosynthesis protein [Clostridium pasteurianum BC1]
MKDENVIDLNEVFYTIKKRKVLIIIITLVPVIISVIISFFIMSPVYESSSTVIIIGHKNDMQVQDPSSQYTNVMMYQSLTKTYADLATSRFIEEKAAQKLGKSITASQLGSSITVTPRDETQLIDIKANGNTPEEALERVQAISEAFSENINSISSIAEVNIVDNGQLPQSPIKPNKKLYIAISFIIGILLSITTAISLERRTEKTVKEVKK